MFRTLCVAVKPSSAHESVCEYALVLAERHHLAIDAVAVIDESQMTSQAPVPLGGVQAKLEEDRQAIAAGRARAMLLTTKLNTRCRELGIHCNTTVCEGNTVEQVSAAIQRCDALVCGRKSGGDVQEDALFFSLLKQSPRPVIVTPLQRCAGAKVLVAYDGSPQAARALASFVASGFSLGQQVYITSYHNNQQFAKSQARTAQLYLQRHGILSEIRTNDPSASIGQQLLDEIESLQVGLLVMGAFGQRAWREFVLGSVTRTILNAMPVPVLLDH